MAKMRRIMLVGGGSGGHIVPNFAVASALKHHFLNLRLCYVGSRKSLDRELVQAQKITFYGLFSGKIRRYFSWRYFIDPFLILLGFFQSLFILLRFRPHVVFSKGGYVSFPIALAAFFLRYPLILHESDAVMGLANRLNGCFAKKICVSFKTKHSSSKIIFTGNPVRVDLLNGSREEGYQLTGFVAHIPTVMIWGGSLGAEQINRIIKYSFYDLVSRFQVIHITGKNKGMGLEHPNYRAYEYIGEDLKHFYAIANFIVGRAGANSLSEIALLQIPNVLIPLKNADQQANATFFEKQGASHVLKKDENLLDILLNLSRDIDRQKKMKAALKKLAQPQAAQNIVKVIKQCLGE